MMPAYTHTSKSKKLHKISPDVSKCDPPILNQVRNIELSITKPEGAKINLTLKLFMRHNFLVFRLYYLQFRFFDLQFECLWIRERKNQTKQTMGFEIVVAPKRMKKNQGLGSIKFVKNF